MHNQTGRARTSCLESCLGRGCNAMLRGSFEADDGLLDQSTPNQSHSLGSKRTKKENSLQDTGYEQPQMLHVLRFPHTHMTMQLHSWSVFPW